MAKSLLHASFLIGLLCMRKPEARSADSSAPGQPKLGKIDWPVYGGHPKANQFVAFAQINAMNVNKLRPAWEYHTGDASQRSTMYANPIVVDGVMYISTPSLRADAATGVRIWSFDPAPHNNGRVIRLRYRGVTQWNGDKGSRIFHFVRDGVYAIDAKTGELIRSLGAGGYINLRQNLGVDPAEVTVEMTTRVQCRRTSILGSRVNETYGASPGHIRAFDAATVKLR